MIQLIGTCYALGPRVAGYTTELTSLFRIGFATDPIAEMCDEVRHRQTYTASPLPTKNLLSDASIRAARATKVAFRFPLCSTEDLTMHCIL